MYNKITCTIHNVTNVCHTDGTHTKYSPFNTIGHAPSTLLYKTIIMSSYQTLPQLFNFQHHGLFKAKVSRNPFSLIGTPEKKLLIVSFYYVTLEVLGFITFSLTQKNSNRLREELQSYFVCESQGYDPDNPCDRSQFERLLNPTITILTLTLFLLAPVVNFVFAIKIQLLKEKLTAFRNIIQTQLTEI